MLNLQALSALEMLCCVPALALLLFATVPVHRGWIRRHVTPRMHATVRRQLSTVLSVNSRLRSPLMDLLTQATDASVSLHFYIIVITVSYLLGYSAESMKFCAGLATTTYLTSALKDLFCSPRPMHIATREQKCQLQARFRQGMEHETSNEYGAPSLHTAAGLCCALVLVHNLVDRWDLSPRWTLMGYALALCWGVWIGLTRVYLGVHTPMDLAMGAVVGCSVFGLWHATADHHHRWVTMLQPPGEAADGVTLEGPGADGSWASWLGLLLGGDGVLFAWGRGATALAAHAGALLWYPRPLHQTESFAHATTFLGAWGGFPLVRMGYDAALGAAAAAAAKLEQLLPASLLPAGDLTAMLLQVGRVIVGFAAVFVTRPIAKALLTPTVKGALELLPSRLRLLIQPPSGQALMSFPAPSSPGPPPAPAASNGTHQPPSPSPKPPAKPARASSSKAEQPASTPAAPSPTSLGRTTGTPDPGIALRPDGYPMDADAIRRYLCYCCMCCTLILYSHATAGHAVPNTTQ